MKRIGISGVVFVLLALFLVEFGKGQFGRRNRRMPTVDDFEPEWQINEEFTSDVFTFVRAVYTSDRESPWGGWSRWAIDYPDSDRNFSYRLQELTALQVNPQPICLQLTDPELQNYPFVYLIEPGYMLLQEEEVNGLRRYLLNGGFLMVDDFWGEDEWDTFHRQIRRVFPDREPVVLPLEHEIFHCVYDLTERPQIPSINHWLNGYRTERPDAVAADYRAILDDQKRIMVLICHNTDLGDGWEREGVDSRYFRECSEKWAYPMGINIVTYAMIH